MPKLLRIFIPLVLVLLAVPSVASADPMDFNTTHTSALGPNLPHSPNFTWLSSVMANSSVLGTAAPGEGWVGTNGQALSDMLFTKIRRPRFHCFGRSSAAGTSFRSKPCSNGCNDGPSVTAHP